MSIPSFEEEELRLRTDVEGPAFFFYSLQLALECPTRVAFEGIPVRHMNVTEYACPARLR